MRFNCGTGPSGRDLQETAAGWRPETRGGSMRTECATVEDAGPFDVSEPLMLLSVGQSYQRGGDAYETAGSRGRSIAVASTDTTLCSRTVAGSWSARSARKAGSPRRVRTSRAERRTRAAGALSADPPSPKRRTTTWGNGCPIGSDPAVPATRSGTANRGRRPGRRQAAARRGRTSSSTCLSGSRICGAR